MEFIQTGQFKPNPLASLISVENPLERISRITFKRLDCLLDFVGEQGESIREEYVQRLKTKYQALLSGDTITERSLDLDNLIHDKPHLTQHRDLAHNVANYHLQSLGLPPDHDWQQASVEVPQRNMLRSVLVPAYLNLECLAQILGRETAFPLHKRFTTTYLLQRQVDQENQVESVDQIFADRNSADDEASDWVMVHGLLGDGKYAYKNENCLWVEALADFPKTDIKYHICCYGDYQGAKSWHQDFVLTMEHTIAQGDPYCSRVVHDTRINWQLEHPPKEFWEQMKV